MDIAVVGGTGVYDPKIFSGLRKETVKTVYGEATVQIGNLDGREVVFLARHGAGHSVPPHRVNYRANIKALQQLGVKRVLATAAVGSCNPEMKPGHFVVVSDFIDFTKSRAVTFFDGGTDGVVHADFSEPYCPQLRGWLFRFGEKLGLDIHSEGVYVCTEGPRFETPAEVRMFARLGGDLLGMTNVPEVVLAREAGLCYGLIALVANAAAGISPKPLSHKEVLETMTRHTDDLRRLVMETITNVPPERSCSCRSPEPLA